MNKIPHDLLEFIDMHDAFYIVGHKEPDGDCAGSQLGLVSYLQRCGKKAWPVSGGPFSKPEVAGWENRFIDTFPAASEWERTAAIIVDCSSLSRAGDIAGIMPKVQVAVIDHHTGPIPRDMVAWVDDTAASLTSMILWLIELRGDRPTRQEAEYLFYGLATDTGFFRHPDETGAEAFRTAARLVDAGASPKKAHAAMYGGKTLASRRMMGEILARIESLADGKLLVSTISSEDQERYGKASRDPDVIYQLMMGVSGCEVAMLVRQESQTGCTVGLRSREKINVAQVASGFGGGGHRLAAGLTMQGSISDVKAVLVAVLEPLLEG